MKIPYEYIGNFWAILLETTPHQSEEVTTQAEVILANPDFLNPVAMVILYMAVALAFASTIKCVATGGSMKESLIRLAVGVIAATILVAVV
jgi:hypothetical protein